MIRFFLVVASVVVAAIVAGGGDWQYGESNPPLLRACEAVLEQRLASPSGYHRIDVAYSTKRFQRDEFEEYLYAGIYSVKTINSKLAQFDEGTIKPTLFHAVISYDAPNLYGVLIREESDCTYFSEAANPEEASELAVKVDGQTQEDWIDEARRKARAGGN